MFFVYRITNKRLNKHYYGSRHAKHATLESLGTTYFSSSKNAEFIEDQKKNPQDYKYKIIKIFKTKNEAIRYESMLHAKFNVGASDNFYNGSEQTETSVKFFGEKTCEYCSLTMNIGNYTRFHGKNCYMYKFKTIEEQNKHNPNKKQMMNKQTGLIEYVDKSSKIDDIYTNKVKDVVLIKTEDGRKYIPKHSYDSSKIKHNNSKKWLILDKNNNVIVENHNISNILNDINSSKYYNLLYGSYYLKTSITFLHETTQLNKAINDNIFKYEGWKLLTECEYEQKKYIEYDNNRVNKILSGRNSICYDIYGNDGNYYNKYYTIYNKEYNNFERSLITKFMKKGVISFNTSHSSWTKMKLKYGYYIGFLIKQNKLTADDIEIIYNKIIEYEYTISV